MDKGETLSSIAVVLLCIGFGMATVSPWIVEIEYSKTVAVGGIVLTTAALALYFAGERLAANKRKSRKID